MSVREAISLRHFSMAEGSACGHRALSPEPTPPPGEGTVRGLNKPSALVHGQRGLDRLIEELGEEAYVRALAEYRRPMRAAFSAHAYRCDSLRNLNAETSVGFANWFARPVGWLGLRGVCRLSREVLALDVRLSARAESVRADVAARAATPLEGIRNPASASRARSVTPASSPAELTSTACFARANASTPPEFPQRRLRGRCSGGRSWGQIPGRCCGSAQGKSRRFVPAGTERAICGQSAM
jgi:hypothetical protein